MQVLRLAGHYGQAVEIDLCAPCHLVWFDPIESARLAGPGLLDLIGAMAAAHSLPHRSARPDLHCPRCRGALRQVHNRTRWGPSLQLECVQRHGAWQTFGQFLGEKGLLRAMSSADRARALARDGALHCVNCGGAVGAGDGPCPWCTSVPALVDVARLARALDPEAATEGHPVHATGTATAALQCAACGAAQPADGGWRCVQCGATLTAPALAEAYEQVSALRPALRAHAAKPPPHVVQARLRAQEPALERQRQRAAEMLAEAEQRLGHRAPEPAQELSLPQAIDALRRLPRWTLWTVGLALALWWWF